MNILLKLSFLLFITLNVSIALSQDNDLNSRAIVLVDDMSKYVQDNDKTFKDYQIFFIHKKNNEFVLSNGEAVGIPHTSSSEIVILKNARFSGVVKVFTNSDNTLHSINEASLTINSGDLLLLYTKDNKKIHSITIK